MHTSNLKNSFKHLNCTHIPHPSNKFFFIYSGDLKNYVSEKALLRFLYEKVNTDKWVPSWYPVTPYNCNTSRYSKRIAQKLVSCDLLEMLNFIGIAAAGLESCT